MTVVDTMAVVDKLSCACEKDVTDDAVKHKQRELLVVQGLPDDELSDFEKAISILTPEQQELLKNLYSAGQEHLFKHFSTANPLFRRQFAKYLQGLDATLNGGLSGYITNAKRLLLDSRHGVNPLEGWTPSVPEGDIFKLGTKDYAETEAIGMPELSKVGFVLVAGGLGERLGYSGIKVALPTEITTNTCYLQFYIEYIIAVQHKHANTRELPLCIMTSADTNARTVELLVKNNYFGLNKSQITIVQQGLGVPALTDNDARLEVSGDDELKIVTKPHGHGDIHELLHKHGVVKKWYAKGLKWLTIFQDTNGLAFHTLPLMLGVSKSRNLLMNSLTVPRKAKQAIGGIAKLTHTATGETRTVNVEYNQLDPLLRSTGQPDGDADDPRTGYSPYPGNINQLLFELEGYQEVLERTKGIMPEFVNPKYTDDTRTVFKKPTRLECMMQDFPAVLNEEESKRVGFTSVPAGLCFSPVKNATADGVALQANGTQPATAATGEADQYNANRAVLRSLGCRVDTGDAQVYNGIKVSLSPAIVFKPSFVLCPGECKVRFPFPKLIKISARSTLIVRGNVYIESLDLDGALFIDCAYGEEIRIKDKKIMNQGWEFVPNTDSTDEVIKMRGYDVVKRETQVIEEAFDACSIL